MEILLYPNEDHFLINSKETLYMMKYFIDEKLKLN